MWLVSGAVGSRWRIGTNAWVYGTMDAQFEVQRTIKRAELTAFLCLLKKVIGFTKVHIDNKGI